jgi:chromosome segregation ATPase
MPGGVWPTERSHEEVMMAKRRGATDKRLEDIHRQRKLYEEQRAKHRDVIDGAPGRRFYLDAEITKRRKAIAVMQRELEEMPAKIEHSRSVVSRLDDQIATLKKMAEDVKTKQRKLDQLARFRQQLAELKKEL